MTLESCSGYQSYMVHSLLPPPSYRSTVHTSFLAVLCLCNSFRVCLSYLKERGVNFSVMVAHEGSAILYVQELLNPQVVSYGLSHRHSVMIVFSFPLSPHTVKFLFVTINHVIISSKLQFSFPQLVFDFKIAKLWLLFHNPTLLSENLVFETSQFTIS